MSSIDLSQFSEQTQDIIRRFSEIDYKKNPPNKDRIEKSLLHYCDQLEIKHKKFIWVDNFNEGCEKYNAARAAQAAQDAWAAPYWSEHIHHGLTDPTVIAWFEICLTKLDLLEAGLFAYWVTDKEIICVLMPEMKYEQMPNNQVRFHCEDGPAISWPKENIFYYHGVDVTSKSWLITEPERITPKDITDEKNIEIKRVMLERFGQERYLKEVGAEILDDDVDQFGRPLRLYKLPLTQKDADPWLVLEETNSTPEPDGHYKTYCVGAHPQSKTAAEARAKSYGFERAKDYHPLVET